MRDGFRRRLRSRWTLAIVCTLFLVFLLLMGGLAFCGVKYMLWKPKSDERHRSSSLTRGQIAVKEKWRTCSDTVWPGVVLLLSAPPGQTIDLSLNSRADQCLTAIKKTVPRILNVLTYYDIVRQIPRRAPAYVSADNSTILITLHFSAPDVQPLVETVEANSTEALKKCGLDGYKMYVTGVRPLDDTTDTTTGDLLKMDGISMPLGIIILALVVHSLKLIVAPLLCIPLSIIVPFGLMFFVKEIRPVEASDVESVMGSIAVAISIDYVLFMTSRFSMECKNGKHHSEAAWLAFRYSGENIFVSGLTMSIAFLGLLAYPLRTMKDFGIAFCMTIAGTMLVNLTFLPSMLFTFACILKPSRWPCAKSKTSRQPLIDPTTQIQNAEPDGNQDGTTITLVEEAGNSQPAPRSDGVGDMGDGSLPEERDPEASFYVHAEAAGNTSTLTTREVEDDTSFMCASTSYEEDPENQVHPAKGDEQPQVKEDEPPPQEEEEEELPEEHEVIKALIPVIDIPLTERDEREIEARKSLYFRIAQFTQQRPLLIVVVLFLLLCPLVWQLTTLTPATSLVFYVDRGKEPYKALQKFSSGGFRDGMGLLYPFTVVIKPRKSLGLLLQPNTTQFWNFTNNVIAKVAAETGIPDTAFYAPSWQYGKETTPDRNGWWDTRTWSKNSDGVCVVIEPTWNPTGPKEPSTVEKGRKAIDSFKGQTIKIGSHEAEVDLYFVSFSTRLHDKAVQTFKDAPIVVGVTYGVVVLIVLLFFRSVVISLVSVITMLYTLSATMGMCVVVFQSPAFRWIPVFKDVHGVEWMVPILGTSFISVLALDYGVFLLTRIKEFRSERHTDRASIILGLSNTGRIISAAGVIMVVAFSGLFLTPRMSLNQLGFALAFSVGLDTFVIRILLLPALLALCCKVNLPGLGGRTSLTWWPVSHAQTGLKDEYGLQLQQPDQTEMQSPASASAAGPVEEAQADPTPEVPSDADTPLDSGEGP